MGTSASWNSMPPRKVGITRRKVTFNKATKLTILMFLPHPDNVPATKTENTESENIAFNQIPCCAFSCFHHYSECSVSFWLYSVELLLVLLEGCLRVSTGSSCIHPPPSWPRTSTSLWSLSSARPWDSDVSRSHFELVKATFRPCYWVIELRTLL